MIERLKIALCQEQNYLEYKKSRSLAFWLTEIESLPLFVVSVGIKHKKSKLLAFWLSEIELLSLFVAMC